MPMPRPPWKTIVPWAAFATVLSAVVVRMLTSGPGRAEVRPWTRDGIVRSQAIGGRIIAALAAHRARTGRLPATLDELVPADLDAIRPPEAGRPRWSYATSDDGKDFVLAFGVDAGFGALHPIGVYASKSGRWIVDD